METVNTLFILASVMENIIIQEKHPQYRHLSKMHFSRVVKEVKRLNSVVNSTLSAEQIKSFDEASDMITDKINEAIEACR